MADSEHSIPSAIKANSFFIVLILLNQDYGLEIEK
jgi:hypothetical protein